MYYTKTPISQIDDFVFERVVIPSVLCGLIIHNAESGLSERSDSLLN